MYWENSPTRGISSVLWQVIAFRIGTVSAARVVCWTMPACPGKIRRHMAAIIALGRVCVGAPSLLQKEVVCRLGAWEK